MRITLYILIQFFCFHRARVGSLILYDIIIILRHCYRYKKKKMYNNIILYNRTVYTHSADSLSLSLLYNNIMTYNMAHI